MIFEYDEQKSKSNSTKHGISFEQAKELWNDSDSIVIPARTTDESRFMLIGKFKNKLWSTIFTIREDKLRIISVRRAHKNEEEIYKG